MAIRLGQAFIFDILFPLNGHCWVTSGAKKLSHAHTSELIVVILNHVVMNISLYSNGMIAESFF